MTDIASPRNERVKLVKALQSRARQRRREGKIVLEGVRLITDALACGLTPEFVLYTVDEVTLGRPAYRLFQQLAELNIPLLSVSQGIMEQISDTETPPGLLAVVPLPQVAMPEVVSLALVLDAMNNPGNLGSALRTAAAAGVDVVILTPNTVDPYNPKALRGGMGAQFRLPILELDWTDIALRFGHLNAYLAAADGAVPYYAVDWLRPSLVIIGGEAHGPTAPARALAAATIAIPMAGQTESLNAAVATGVILYEARRQRTLSTQKGA